MELERRPGTHGPAGPVDATAFAREMAARGHEVQVVTANPHYPPEAYPQRFRPAPGEVRDGIPGPPTSGLDPAQARRSSASERKSRTALGVVAATPLMRRADVIVAVSPAFLALAPTMATRAAPSMPLDSVVAGHPSGCCGNNLAWSRAAPCSAPARWLERAAYSSAARIVTISDSFSANLVSRGSSQNG